MKRKLMQSSLINNAAPKNAVMIAKSKAAPNKAEITGSTAINWCADVQIG